MTDIKFAPMVEVGENELVAGEKRLDTVFDRELFLERVRQFDGDVLGEVAPREAGKIVEVVRLGHEVPVTPPVGLRLELEGADVVGADRETFEQALEN